jgi:ubiquinone/menaquinone biosynthesis C-methylase UbiE
MKRPDGSLPLTKASETFQQEALDWYTTHSAERGDLTEHAGRILRAIAKLIELPEHPRVCVLGCGPVPLVIPPLVASGCTVVGIEPIEGSVGNARTFLGGTAEVLLGAAESIPLPDGSQDVMLFETVLEHVDSVHASLSEMYRVLKPGGILYLSTVNRLRFSPTGHSGEFNVPFYNWLPKAVKEAYVFRHLHVDPTLANYSPRPAVHWFTFQELCDAGRAAGFAQFYSSIDVMDPDDPSLTRSSLRRFLLRPDVVRMLRERPWLRAAAITQFGGQIYMWKRPA